MENKIKKYIFVINHFRGFPELESKQSRKIRYVNLLKLLCQPASNDKKMEMIQDSLILYNNTHDVFDKELNSIIHIAKDNNWPTQDFNPLNYDNLEELLKDLKINCNPNETHIILGGTNISGCLLWNSHTCLKNWTKLGYNVTLELSLSSEYQHAEVTQDLKSKWAISLVYDFIKKNKLLDKVDITCDIDKWVNEGIW